MPNLKNIPVEFQGQCAVAGDVVDTRIAEENGLVANYEGKKYYFCCPPCKAPFLANPENYTGNKKEAIQLEFKGKEHITDNVWSFSFTSKSPIHWEAGQYLRLVVPHDNPDARGIKRWFTISSAPYEKDITITTRVSDSTFKQALSKLNQGDKASVVDLPGGDFRWSNADETSRVFIIGGIGITPFYSIAKQRQHDNLPVNATLLYANRSDDVPFREYFDDLKSTGLIARYMSGDDLTIEAIMAATPSSEQTVFYISGAKPMVARIVSDLISRGASEESIISDEFSHYSESTY